jgi:hypothetical protein
MNEGIAKNMAAEINSKRRTVQRKCGGNVLVSTSSLIEEMNQVERVQSKSRVRKGSDQSQQSDCSTRHSSSNSLHDLFSPKERLQMNLISDYGREIDTYMRELMN